MSSNADVKIIVTLHDQGSRNLLQQLGLIDSATGKVNASAVQAGGALHRMGSDGAQSMRAAGTSAQSVESHMRGIGTAARTTGAQIGNMRQPLAAIDTQVRGIGERMKSWGSMGAQAVAGISAAKMVGGALIEKPVSFDARAQLTANTAAHDKDGAGKIAEKANVKAAVEVALIQAKGGTQDGALSILDKTIETGAMSAQEAYKALPSLLMAQIGSGINDNDFGELVGVLANSGFKGDEINSAISELVKGGQKGSFNADAMVSNGFAKLMQNNIGMGMNKQDALRQTTADLQMLKRATGSDSAAATNYENLQNKIMSADLQKSMKKEFKIDLQAELKKEAAAGNSPITGFQNVVDRIIEKQGSGKLKQEYAGLKQAQDNGASPAEIQSRLNAIEALDVSGTLSQIITDMQALGGLKGLRTFKEVGQDVQESMKNDKGEAVKGNWEANTSTTQAAIQRNGAANDQAEQRALDGGGGQAISAINDGLANLKNEFPALSAAVSASTIAMGILTAAISATGLAGILTGKGGRPSLPGKGGKTPIEIPAQVRNAAGQVVNAAEIAAARSAQAAASAGILSKATSAVTGFAKSGMAAKGLGVVGAGLTVYGAGKTLMDSDATGHDKAAAVGNAAGSLGGGWGGAAMGAALGTALLPGIGTAVGALIGGALGAWAGGAAGEAVGGAVVKQNPQPPAAPAERLTFSNQYGMSDQSRAANSAALRGGQSEASAQALIQSNAQLQQVNAQIAQLNQISNNAPLEAQMTAVAGSVAALASKPAPVTNITSNLVVDGSVVATMVNRYNGGTVARGA